MLCSVEIPGKIVALWWSCMEASVGHDGAKNDTKVISDLCWPQEVVSFIMT